MTTLTDKPHARHRQITDQLRARIQNGELLPGTRLPTIHELAEQFGTSYFTVQTALSPLVEQGLLQRLRRHGTVVCGAKTRQLKNVGVYYGSGFWDNEGMPFFRSLHAALEKQFLREHIERNLWLDPRPAREQDTPLPELVRALKTQGLDCLIITVASGRAATWLNRLPVPTVLLTSGADIHNGVSFDFPEFLGLSLASLKQQGCRRVAVISPVSFHRGTERQQTAAVVDLARQHGLASRPEWVRIMQDGDWGEDAEHFWDYGRREFEALWAAKEHPDGLIVYPDTMARRVLRTLDRLKVRIPQDLRLAFHRNAEVSFPCDWPVAWVESSAAQVAEALLRQARRQVACQPLEPILVPFTLDASGLLTGDRTPITRRPSA